MANLRFTKDTYCKEIIVKNVLLQNEKIKEEIKGAFRSLDLYSVAKYVDEVSEHWIVVAEENDFNSDDSSWVASDFDDFDMEYFLEEEYPEATDEERAALTVMFQVWRENPPIEYGDLIKDKENVEQFEDFFVAPPNQQWKYDYHWLHSHNVYCEWDEDGCRYIEDDITDEEIAAIDKLADWTWTNLVVWVDMENGREVLTATNMHHGYEDMWIEIYRDTFEECHPEELCGRLYWEETYKEEFLRKQTNEQRND